MPEIYAPLVSVVMPTYNRSDLLPATIETILNQSFTDLELIIVDDGSDDDTKLTVDTIKRRDSRVCYIPLPVNRGIGFARDVGLRYASGQYVALADSDDHWLPDKLAIQVSTFEKHPEIDILYSDFHNIDSIRGTTESGFHETKNGLAHLQKFLLEPNLWLVNSGIEKGILSANFVQPASMIIRHESFNRIGSFDIFATIAPDLEFAWRAAVLGAQYAYHDICLINRYRLHSSVTAQTEATALQRIDVLQTCRLNSANFSRDDLIYDINEAERNTWRKLVIFYGRNGKRWLALKAFYQSIGLGLSSSTIASLLFSMLGPRVLDLALKTRK